MGASGGSSKSSGQQWSRPWEAQQPYLKDIYKYATQAFQGGGVPGKKLEFGPSRIAERDPYTQAMNQAIAQRGVSGPVQQAMDYNQDVLGGRYMNANPYLDEMYDRMSGRVGQAFNRIARPGAAMATAGAGRGAGVLGAQEGRLGDALAQQLGDLGSNVYGREYGRERGMMEAAAGRAPGLSQASVSDLMASRGAGMFNEDYRNRQLQEAWGRQQFGQEEPYMRIAKLAGLIGAPVTESYGKQSSNAFNMPAGLWPT